MSLATLIASTILTASISHSATLRVPAEYSTIASALGSALFGDTIEISCGTYYEHDLVVPSGVTLRSETGFADCVTIDAQNEGRVLFLDGSQGCRIEGIVLRNGYSTRITYSRGQPGLSDEVGPDENGRDSALLEPGPFAPWLDRIREERGTPSGATLRNVLRRELVETIHAETPGIEFSLSASPHSPWLNQIPSTGEPVQVYLWVVCSEIGLSALEATVSSTFPSILGFIPEGGVLNLGDQNHLLLAVPSCPQFSYGEAAIRLGFWFLSGTQGTLSFHESSSEHLFASVDCDINPSLHENPSTTGFRMGTGEVPTVGTLECSRELPQDLGGGGGVYAVDATADIIRCRFEENRAKSHGGAFRSVRSAITFLQCEFEENQANGHGGGLSMEGPGHGTFDSCGWTQNAARTGGALYVADLDSSSCRNSLFWGNRSYAATNRGAGNAVTAKSQLLGVSSCTFFENRGSRGSATVYVAGTAHVNLGQSILSFDLDGAALLCDTTSTADVSCSDLFGNAGGNFSGCASAFETTNGNFSSDPLFCDADSGIFAIDVNSPCSPQFNECHLIVGSGNLGCENAGVSIQSSPTGLLVVADGLSAQTPVFMPWPTGSTHTLGTTTPQTLGGTRHNFLHWSDGGSISHSIVVADSAAPFLASFDTEYLLLMVAHAGGLISPETGWRTPGSQVTISAAPVDSNWVFQGWVGAGDGSYSGTDPVAVVTMNAPLTQTPHFAYVGNYPLTMVADDGGTASPPSQSLPVGTQVTITATPDPDYAFTGWSGEGVGSYTGTNNPASVTMSGAVTQTAHFVYVGNYQLTMTPSAGGTVTPTSGPFPALSTVQIQATPSVGYVFGGWTGSGPGSYTGLNPTATITMNGDITQTASFILTNFQLTMSKVGSGTTSPPSGPYPAGQTLTITATPGEHYFFKRWNGAGNGSYSGTDSTATITMLGSIGQQAVFMPVQYPLTMIAGPGGVVTPASGPRDYGSNVTITATPNPGYSFVSWTGTGPGSYSGAANPRSITILGPITETASFVLNSYSVQISATGGGTVNTPGGIFPYGTQLTIEAVPDPGFAFLGWTGSGSGSYSGTQNPVTITVQGPIFETAQFASGGTVTITSTPSGLPLRVDGVTITTPQSYEWAATSTHTVAADSIVPATADSRYRFMSWSDGLARQHTYTVPVGGGTLDATFQKQFLLTVTPSSEGTTEPGTSWQDELQNLLLFARPGENVAFESWTGTGTGSYTGGENPAPLVILGPITQSVTYHPLGFNFTISASDTDPYVQSAAPTQGLRSLHLWLTCAEEGLSAMQCTVSGSLDPLAFSPAPNVYNLGTESDLLLGVGGCPAGDTVAFRVGEWLVNDFGGTFCIAENSTTHPFVAVECDSISPSLTTNPRLLGFSSSASPGCVIDENPCFGSPPPSPWAGLRSLGPGAVPTVSVDAFQGIRPNPFAHTTEIQFSLAEPRRTIIAIYDVGGRLKTRLYDAVLGAGNHSIPWSANESGALRVPPGVYFVRLEAGPLRTTQKIVLLNSR